MIVIVLEFMFFLQGMRVWEWRLSDVRLAEKEELGLPIYPFDNRDVFRISLYFSANLHLETVDDIIDSPMPQHHFLVVALDLMSISRLDQEREMLEHFDSLPLCLRVKDVPEVHQVSDVDVVLHHIPPVELVFAVPLPEGLEDPPALYPRFF